jgi:hypothetical protein
LTRRLFCVAALLALLGGLAPTSAPAATTGSLRGKVVDSATNAPIAGAKVTVESPSEQASTTTDAGGNFAFISLGPDSYVIAVDKTGYQPISRAGVLVQANQSQDIILDLSVSLKTIGTVHSRTTGGLVHSGVTSDVYSINPAAQGAAAALGGSGALNQAYGAISSAPGVNVPSGQQGWYQSVYIRGGDYDQVAYEFDGLPMVRESDGAPITTLSGLGNQEVQVYTGGTPATSDSPGLAGYVNQVIKTGTYPGFKSFALGIGGPQFYHQATFELGGATKNRLFSYYFGTMGANQDYRYGSQFNGAGDPLFFYPLTIPTSNISANILDGSSGTYPNYGAQFSPPGTYGQASNADRETVANVHIGLKHHNDSYHDDLQLLYVTGYLATNFYSSAAEIGLPGPLMYLNSTYYTGALGAAPDNTQLAFGGFPSAPNPTGYIGYDQRDGSSNAFAIEKLQYQRNINTSSYLRFYAYSEYTNWFINGPTSANLLFGPELADYEVLGHIYGGNLTYSNQLSSQHLLTASASYLTQKLQTYNALFNSIPGPGGANPGPGVNSSGLGTIVSNYVDAKGNCYNYTTGAVWSCFDAGSQGGVPPGGGAVNLTPGTAPGGSAAAQAGAQWIMTENGRAAQVDNVTPNFTSLAITDVYHPNTNLTVNLGVRVDNFAYRTDDLSSGYPTRQFWFNAFNNEYCGAPGQTLISRWSGSSFGSCPTGYSPLALSDGSANPGVGLTNVSGGTTSNTVVEPRIAATYGIGSDTVLRASYGRYARPAATSYKQYNTVQQDLPSFLAQFYPFGYTTPNHNVNPDTSDNFDFSLEQHIAKTNLSFKLTPFYRSTSNQLQYLAIDALGGTLAGVNVGSLTTKGLELAFSGGDFSSNGLAFRLAYTYTNSTITYKPVANGVSVIDNLNNSIKLYNSYTSACSGVTPSSPNWVACGSGGAQYTGNAQSTLAGAANDSSGNPIQVPNPYYASSLQPLMDPNGHYTPYDVIPSPFNAANGYEVPNVASLILNYRRGPLAVTPTLTFSDGSYYGSPLVYPGYVPQSCTEIPGTSDPNAPGRTCTGDALHGGNLFLPDPYTGKFDTLGQFRQPSQLTLNLQLSYDIAKNVSLRLLGSNLYSKCYQRGYAWDDPNTCVYSNLPSNILAPAGNFLTNPPVQVKYPYGAWFNITQVGYWGVIQPFQATVNLDVRL